MARIDRRSLAQFDWVLTTVVVALLAAGLVNLYSATGGGTGGELSGEMKRQIAALGIGLAAAAAAVVVDYRHLERLAFPIYAACLALLALTLAIAPVIRGNQSWLVFGPVRLQPSELAKVAMVIALARVLHRQGGGGIRSWKDVVLPAALAAAPVALIILQHDMGVAMLTLLVACTYLPFLRISLRAWAAIAVAGVAVLAGVWFFALQAYQRSRILDFLDPARDPLASGYQAIQSKIAVGSGGLFGKGWMDGTQTQLRFLPTQHTDFIFSVLGEEWGLVGGGVVLGAYLVMLLWGLWIASSSKDAFGTLLAVGLVGTLFWPAVINVAMVLGLAPVIGVPLPLFSYGGSALIASLVALGILLNVSMRRYMF